MDLIASIELLALGYNLKALTVAEAGEELTGKDRLLDILRKTGDVLGQLELSVSREIFKDRLGPLAERFQRQIDDRPPADALLAEADAQELCAGVQTLIEAVRAEIKTRFIARPTSTRFALEQLLVAPETLFGQGIFDSLPEIARTDLKEGGACLAFGRPTAAAFHLLRCVEECVRWLHRAYFPRERSRPPKNWGQIMNELKIKKRKPTPDGPDGPDGALLERLDHLRKHFRNPTQHPEKVYELEEAEDLLYLCIEPISNCARDNRVKARGEKAR